MLTLLFDGIVYGMLLFVLAVGLAVTLGLMNFINLARPLAVRAELVEALVAHHRSFDRLRTNGASDVRC